MTEEPSKRHSLADGMTPAQLRSPVSFADMTKMFDTVTMALVRSNHELREAVSTLNARIDALEDKAASPTLRRVK